MRIADETLVKLLQQTGKITDEKLAPLAEEAKKLNRPLLDVVLKRSIVGEKELTKLYAAYLEVPFTALEPNTVTKGTLSLIPERIARQYNAVVFSVADGAAQLAMEDPEDVQAINFLQKYIGSKFKLFMATREDILMTLENYREEVSSQIDKVIEVQAQKDGPANADQAVKEEDVSENSPVAQTVNLLLEYAIRSGASDIHLEPREDYLQVRYRIDGVLKEANRLPAHVVNALISRIKILAALKIDERRVPQDGRFKITVAGKKYALRVSTLPISDGEKVVMRILDESNRALSLESLGYWGRDLEEVNKALVQPHGMVLVTGPTGSGKSTSLFSALTILNRPEVNISTVEDPVEYKIVGANQTQVNPKAGMTFVAGLRALLRQDPNIIMVGEIRDGETANLAVQAALTGHLVFSTLHTNNAATCLPRLLDMGIEPFLIASTVRAVIGQRLVRRLCTNCREQHAPSPEEIAEISSIFHLTDAAAFARLHALEARAAKEKIGVEEKNMSTTESGIQSLWKARTGGCDNCNKTGYKGRMGIYEVLTNSNNVQRLIVGSGTSEEIQRTAIAEGMTTMQVDGFIKSLRGETSIEEILRVTRE
ncbi:type II/IV secretion system protein [Candidatus Saccharibacteria bacterium]|nr:type II/IV secretion system protein [Candidatus Saccharibacteria bacterium]